MNYELSTMNLRSSQVEKVHRCVPGSYMMVNVASVLVRFAGVMAAVPGYIGLANPIPKVRRIMRCFFGFFGSESDTELRPRPKRILPLVSVCRDTSVAASADQPRAFVHIRLWGLVENSTWVPLSLTEYIEPKSPQPFFTGQ